MAQAGRSGLSKWRWALVAITAAMGAALLYTAWSSRVRVDEASEVLVIGQAESLFRALRNHLDENPDLTDEDLARFVTENQAFGVRFVEIRLGDGKARRAGTAAEPVPEHDRDLRMPFYVARTGEHIRLLARVPRRPPNRMMFSATLPPPGAGVGIPRPPPPLPPPPGDRGLFLAGPGPLNTRLVLDFEPVVGNRLREDARQAFILSCAVAVSFALASGLLFRLLRQRDLAEARAEQARRLSMLGEMSAVLAHEIRNPLASLKGHAQLLAEQLSAGTPERRKIDRVVDEARRIETLSRSLLEFVRSGSIERRPTDPRRLVSDSVSAIEHPVEIDESDAPSSFPLDPVRMQQVLTNLLENAAQVSVEGRSIVVRIARAGASQLTISVRDFGPGITAGQEKRIFEAFHTTKTRGVGLGLAVAERIVEMHGGSIRAFNHSGGGAVFEVTIPEE